MNSSVASSPSFAAWIGLDWGDKEHAWSLAGPQEEKECGKLAHSAEGLHGWLKSVGKRFGGRPVALALEANRGPLLNVFVQFFITFYPVQF